MLQIELLDLKYKQSINETKFDLTKVKFFILRVVSRNLIYNF